MHETGIEPYYVMKDGKKLRFGYTTGTCASAAAKAATMMLLTGKTPPSVRLMTPKGIELDLEVLEPEYKDGAASCAIKKFSGDDPDVTDGVLVYAEAKLRSEPGVGVDGGVGVGRVTKPGLKQPIGAAAINPVPMEMIRRAAEEAMDDCGATVGIDVTISIPAGVGLAWRANSFVDRFFGVLNQILMSVPSFFIGILFTFLFGLVLKWFTPGEFVSYRESVPRFLLNIIFPALAIALPKCTMVVKLLRGNLLAEYGKDYARTAYSRGNDTRGVIRRHLLRNAMLPVVTFLAFTLADIVAGSIIVEQIFTISGLGRLLLGAIGNRDYPVVQAIIVILATIVIVVNTAADIVNQYLDPRLRLR